MERIISDRGSKFKYAEERLICAFKALLKNPEATKLANEDVVAAVEVIEKRTSKRRVTGLLKFKDVSYNLLCIG